MGDIKVTDKSGTAVLYTIHTDDSGKVDKVEAKPGASPDQVNDAAKMQNLLKGVELGKAVESWSLDHLFEKLGEAALKPGESGVDAKETLKRLQVLSDSISDLKDKIKTEEALTSKDQPKIAFLKKALDTAESQLGKLVADIKGVESDLDPAQMQKFKSIATTHGLDAGGTSSGGGKAQMTTPQQNAPQTGAPPQQSYPTAGKASGLPAGGQFDLNKILQSSMFSTMNADALGTMGKNQMEQKKMMQLFMYFAMMAMSGDVGAMTSFMQFITTMILKDKSMQNVNMANKLIELEDASRKATDELLNTPSFDPNNQQVGADFTKTMEKVKADQGSIATSQKLIAQMMEEFAQVSEFLNNLQKSLLDVRGRILSRVSSFNS